MQLVDVRGREVWRSHGWVSAKGYRSMAWDGKGTDGRLVPTGIYLVRMACGGRATTERIVIARWRVGDLPSGRSWRHHPVSLSYRLILDIADVLIVAALFYRILTLVRGTRAAQMFAGLAALALMSVAAEWLQLNALDWLLSSLKTVWVIGFLVVFQPELRKGLAQLGGSRVFKKFLPVADTARLGEIQKALEAISNRRMGAIVVIERNVGLRSFVETGTRIEAIVTAELLETIFTPPSPLHDGAVVIRGDQIVAAGCILPLSQNPEIERTLGTRHRAIVGLSEETDAIAIAVSEETSQISIAERGIMRTLKSPAELRSYLGSVLLPKREEGMEERTPTAPVSSDQPGAL